VSGRRPWGRKVRKIVTYRARTGFSNSRTLITTKPMTATTNKGASGDFQIKVEAPVDRATRRVSIINQCRNTFDFPSKDDIFIRRITAIYVSE
jgi:hypothetical protein